MKEIKWHFRNNSKRKSGNSNQGKHPSLVVGESDDKKSFINIGLTHSQKRGHHNNTQIHDPQNWNKTSYLRDDIRTDPKTYLKEVLNGYNLCPDDIDKIYEIIKKKNPH